MTSFAVRGARLGSHPELDPDEMDRLLAEGATLPAVFYTDAGIAALEDELIFRPSWQMVGIEPELRDAGDYFTTEIAGFGFAVPVVVLRDEDLQLRAFVNVCRHRAHLVAVGCGNHQSLECSDRGWVYGLDGRLQTVPPSEASGLPPFEDLGLLPLPIDSWKGYVFVCLRQDEALAVALGEFPGILESNDFVFPFAAETIDASFRYTRSVSRYGGQANWKVMNENNIECYHCPTTHTHSFSAMYKVDPGTYLHREFDRGVYHTSYYRDSVAKALGLGEGRDSPDYQFYYLWPNMYLEGGSSRYRASLMRLWPDGVHAWQGETVRYELPGDTAIESEVDAQLAEWNRMTAEEDTEVAARVQAGLRSGMYTWGYTLPESERNMRHFYRLVWKALEPAFRA